jgi:hypothetical protein
MIELIIIVLWQTTFYWIIFFLYIYCVKWKPRMIHKIQYNLSGSSPKHFYTNLFLEVRYSATIFLILPNMLTLT